MKFTLVLGVDRWHIEHFKLVRSNWFKHKPSLKRFDLVFFSDDSNILNSVYGDVRIHHLGDIKCILWNPNVEYVSDGTRWTDPQRQKMLAGFVHVAAGCVETDYWLKLDLDVIATGQDDWVNPTWFESRPAIVSHRWGYTKPANQMLDLDEWADINKHKWDGLFENTKPLNLRPKHPTSAGVGHKRIISWCGFFRSDFTRLCSKMAIDSVGEGRLPVPSQDGYMWYVARRLGYPIVRANMKALGWKHFSKLRQLKEELGEEDYA
jgi:hypothetical protein